MSINLHTISIRDSLVDTWTFVHQADFGLLLLAGGIFYLVYPIRGVRWQVLLANAGYRRADGYAMPGFWGFARLLVIAAIANGVTIAQLGDAYRAYLVKKTAIRARPGAPPARSRRSSCVRSAT